MTAPLPVKSAHRGNNDDGSGASIPRSSRRVTTRVEQPKPRVPKDRQRPKCPVRSPKAVKVMPSIKLPEGFVNTPYKAKISMQTQGAGVVDNHNISAAPMLRLAMSKGRALPIRSAARPHSTGITAPASARAAHMAPTVAGPTPT